MKKDKHLLRKRLIWVSNISTPYRIPIWRELSKGFDLTIILMSGKERNRNWERLEQSENYQVIYLDSKSIWLSNEVPLYFSISKIRKTLNRLRPELIYVDGYEHPVYQYIFYRYRKNTKVKTYLGYRGTKASQRFKGNIYNVLRRFLFSNADFVVTAGEDSTRAAMDCGISRERILELFNPIDTDYFKPSSFETWQEDSPHKFLYVGQLIKRKNIDQIIKAFSICREIGDTLEIVGVGEEHNSLFEIMNDLDLGTSIVFRGGLSQHELFSLYNSAHTLVLVSHREVWGLVVNEALSCGMHVVISKNIGSYNSVKNMPGVYACNLGEEEIALAMAQSKTKFRGRILNPQIRSLSTTNFAQKLSDYFES